MHRHVQRRQPVLDDSLEVPRFQVGQRREVAVTEGQPVIVVPDVQGLSQAGGIAVYKAEVAVIRAAPDPGRLEHDAHRQPLGTFDVVLDLLPRREPSAEHELLVGGQELPVEKVLERLAIDLE